jgi:hypothetical protein
MPDSFYRATPCSRYSRPSLSGVHLAFNSDGSPLTTGGDDRTGWTDSISRLKHPVTPDICYRESILVSLSHFCSLTSGASHLTFFIDEPLVRKNWDELFWRSGERCYSSTGYPSQISLFVPRFLQPRPHPLHNFSMVSSLLTLNVSSPSQQDTIHFLYSNLRPPFPHNPKTLSLA